MDATAVSEALARAGLRPKSAAPLVLERGWPLPKVPVMLRLVDPDAKGKKRRWWSVYVVDSGRLPFPFRSAVKHRRAAWVEDLHAVVQSFPDDLLLEGVSPATASRQALPVIAAALPQNGGDWSGLSASVLGYKPSRRLTVRYRLRRSQASGKTLFGKGFPVGSDLESLAVQGALEKAIRRDRLARLVLPEVVTRVPEWNMLLWRRLPGQSVFDMLGTPDVVEAAGLAGRCLADLHGSSTQWQGVHDRSREMQTTRAWVGAVVVGVPDFAAELLQTLRVLERSLSTPKASRLVPSHRDFYDKQIVVQDGRVALLDLETVGRAEAELDVANFLAHLELRALQGRQPDSGDAAQAFLDGYCSGSRLLDRKLLGAYLASSLLRLSCVYSFRADGVDLSRRLQVAARKAAMNQ